MPQSHFLTSPEDFWVSLDFTDSPSSNRFVFLIFYTSVLWSDKSQVTGGASGDVERIFEGGIVEM